MSGADAPERLLDAATSRGVREGVGALSLQAIATEAGTSKALLLYHYGDKSTLMRAMRERLERRAAARIAATAAASSAGALDGWRDLVRDEIARGELALLAALALEADARPTAASATSPPGAARGARDEAASRLAAAVLRSVGLSPRVPARFLGAVLLRHLDGLAVAAAQQPFGDEELEAELDACALALLGLGR